MASHWVDNRAMAKAEVQVSSSYCAAVVELLVALETPVEEVQPVRVRPAETGCSKLPGFETLLVWEVMGVVAGCQEDHCMESNV